MPVLVVEDEAVIALDMRLELEDNGFNVVVASNLEAARNLLPERKFRWALLDLSLGKKSTLPIAEELHKRGTRICFVTGSDISRETLDRFDATLFAKPVDVKTICRHISDPEGSSERERPSA